MVIIFTSSRSEDLITDCRKMVAKLGLPNLLQRETGTNSLMVHRAPVAQLVEHWAAM